MVANLPVYQFYHFTSLLKHIAELRILLADSPVDVLSINETRLDHSIKVNNVYTPGYEIIRRDRENNGGFGGGVCFCIRTNINFTLRCDLNINELKKKYVLKFQNPGLSLFLKFSVTLNHWGRQT